MKKVQVSLTLALLLSALFLLVFVAMTAIGGFIFGRVARVSIFRTVAQIAGGLAAVSFFVTAGIIAVQTALQPASRWRKFLYVLPVNFLGLLLVGVLWRLVTISCVNFFRPHL